MTAFLQLVAQIQNPTAELSRQVPASQATRRNLSYVPQGNTLFSGTVRENLRMGNPEATDEEMIADIGCPQDGSRRRSSIDPLKNHRVNSADYERKHALPFRGDRDLLPSRSKTMTSSKKVSLLTINFSIEKQLLNPRYKNILKLRAKGLNLQSVLEYIKN